MPLLSKSKSGETMPLICTYRKDKGIEGVLYMARIDLLLNADKYVQMLHPIAEWKQWQAMTFLISIVQYSRVGCVFYWKGVVMYYTVYNW